VLFVDRGCVLQPALAPIHKEWRQVPPFPDILSLKPGVANVLQQLFLHVPDKTLTGA
jgi:hypothetical protein